MSDKFLLTAKAIEDVDHIFQSLANENPDVAERVLEEMYLYFRRLGDAAGIGHYREELADREHRFATFYSYVICYAWKPRPIRVVAVLHDARQLERLLSSRIGLQE